MSFTFEHPLVELKYVKQKLGHVTLPLNFFGGQHFLRVNIFRGSTFLGGEYFWGATFLVFATIFNQISTLLS
jgi:hypothetical protein